MTSKIKKPSHSLHPWHYRTRGGGIEIPPGNYDFAGLEREVVNGMPVEQLRKYAMEVALRWGVSPWRVQDAVYAMCLKTRRKKRRDEVYNAFENFPD